MADGVYMKNYCTLQLLLIIGLLKVVYANLNLYIVKEDLRKDLNLDFGSDIYLVADGEPAPLLLKPGSFHTLLAPLPFNIEQICFRWNSFPLLENKHISYKMKVSSSDVDVMPVPKVTVPLSAVVPLYEHSDSDVGGSLLSATQSSVLQWKIRMKLSTFGFKLLFPCSGLKEGLVDLGFHLNYTNDSVDEVKRLDIIVRRHCAKQDTVPHITARRNDVNHAPTAMQNLVIILSSVVTVLLILLMFCVVNWQLQKRKRKIQRKYDHQCEFMLKNKEDNTYKSCTSEPNSDNETIEQDDINQSPSPIYVQKSNLKSRKKRSNADKNARQVVDRTKIPYCTSSLPSDMKLFSRFSLENIPEEELTIADIDVIISECQDASVSSRDQTCDVITVSPCRKKMKNFDVAADNSSSSVYNNKKGNEHVHSSVWDERSEDCYTIPMHRKTNIDKLNSKNVREDDRTRFLAREKKLESIYQYLNFKWMKQFHDNLISQQRIIISAKHPLGKGGSSNVHHGKLRELDDDDNIALTPVALKTLTSPDDCDCITKFFTEALMMKRLRHQNIMSLTGILLQTGQSPVVVMPYLANMDLNQFLRNARGTPKRHQTLSTRQLINFGVQVACGMEYLEAMKFVHRDLASRNCMVSEKLEIKISNLGLARDISKKNYRLSRKTRLPIKWVAPESLTNFVFSEKSDVWSYGVVLWEIMNMGKQPYTGLSNQDVREYIQQGNRLEQTSKCPDDIFHLMSLCWIESPHDRPSFNELHKQISIYEAKYQKYGIEYLSSSESAVVVT